MFHYKAALKSLALILSFSSSAMAENVNFLQNIETASEGAFKAGLFYDNVEKTNVTLGLEQKNIFGTDDHAFMNFRYGEHSSAFETRFTDPDIFETIWSRTLSFSSRQLSPNTATLRSFAFGGFNTELSFSRPINSNKSLGFIFGFDLLDFQKSQDLPTAVLNSAALQNNKLKTSYLAVQTKYSSLIGTTFPTSGSEINASFEIGDVNSISYTLSQVSAQKFYPLSEKVFITSKIATSIGSAHGSEFPFNKNTPLGGAGTLRGFKHNSLGLLSPLNVSGEPAALGGQFAMAASLEVGTLLGASEELVAFIFFDAGNASNNRQDMRIEALEHSRGIGLRWKSPLGPIDASYAKAINPSNPNLIEEFQISLGSFF
jgi:outer membrane protein assembly factor BamA